MMQRLYRLAGVVNTSVPPAASKYMQLSLRKRDMANSNRFTSLFFSTSSNGEDEQKNDAHEHSHEHHDHDHEHKLEEPEMVEMWNKEGVAGPEWNGPRGYEPTQYGDWASKGRVTDF